MFDMCQNMRGGTLTMMVSSNVCPETKPSLSLDVALLCNGRARPQRPIVSLMGQKPLGAKLGQGIPFWSVFKGEPTANYPFVGFADVKTHTQRKNPCKLRFGQILWSLFGKTILVVRSLVTLWANPLRK